ncbi:MAG: hypothetical protein GX977_10525 [Firmicutes bacterium]|nr:hypothetical protein [Bacillota bacterium]
MKFTAAREEQAELPLSQEEHRQNLRKELDVSKARRKDIGPSERLTRSKTAKMATADLLPA